MFFDDRLATVLRQRAGSDVGLRTQFRQLLDILGAEKVSARSARDPSLVATAWMRMDALGEKIPAADRARMVREEGWRFRNPELASHLADFEPDVAAAALSRAELSSDDWAALIPRLPVRARGFLRLRKDLPEETEVLLERLGVHDRGLPSPEGDDEIAAHEAVPEVALSGDDAGFEPPPTRVVPSSTSYADRSRYDDLGSEDLGSEDLETEDSERGELPPYDFPADIEADAPTPFFSGSVPEAEPTIDLDDTDRVKKHGLSNQDFPDQDPLIDPASEGRSEISALVERIARFKRTRESDGAFDSTEPRLPLGEDQLRIVRTISAFGFSADAAGRIEWADSEVAAMVIGTRLVSPPRLGSPTTVGVLERAFTRRQPITEAETELNGAEAIAGRWSVNAQPRFTEDGNFSGYVGRFRRPASAEPTGPTPAQREADRIRQLLHELRTPVTAVQGYAEVIQQQLFGAAPHEYRALAAAIAGDAARILAGFEELDRLAKMETGADEIEAGETNLAALAAATCRQLDQVLHPRMAGISLTGAQVPCIVPLNHDQVEVMIWRLLATLGGGCAAGEMLNATIEAADAETARLACELPTQLLTETDIFAAEAKPIGTAINAGLFGAGFALRLARAEARAAGGDLLRDEERLVLSLPLLGDEAAIDDREETDLGSRSDT